MDSIQECLDRHRGMDNIGATCYQNALLQLLFEIRPLYLYVNHQRKHAEHRRKKSDMYKSLEAAKELNKVFNI